MITLYLVDIKDFTLKDGIDLISPKRREKIERYVSDANKIRGAVAGLLLRYAFGKDADEVVYTPTGKPYISGKEKFNLSHSADKVVLGVAEGEVGVDIEKIAEKDIKSAIRCCHMDEMIWLSNGFPTKGFFEIWVGKESVMKATGEGFYLDPKTVRAVPYEKTSVCRDKTWYLTWIEVEGYACCVASEKDDEVKVVELTKADLLK